MHRLASLALCIGCAVFAYQITRHDLRLMISVLVLLFVWTIAFSLARRATAKRAQNKAFAEADNASLLAHTPAVKSSFRAYIALFSSLLLTVSLLSSPLWEPFASRWLWQKLYGETQEITEGEPPAANAAAEEWLYGQHKKALDDALAAVPKSDEKTPALYALSVAGVASQRVFEREVKAVTQLMKNSGALYAGQLINSKSMLDDAPIATLTSLTDMITRIGQQMHREQDVLLLYLTSHGSRASEGHEFQLEHGGAELAQLRPEDLRTLLDAANIKHRVIIISACYAGGWANAMKDDNTVVMMAARADRTSFGCTDHNDWTWFGEALMKEQWPTLKANGWDLKKAFEAAKATVAAREKTEDYESSEPQASFGATGLKQFQKVMSSTPSSLAREKSLAPSPLAGEGRGEGAAR
jgi:Peptidase C13 family